MRAGRTVARLIASALVASALAVAEPPAAAATCASRLGPAVPPPPEPAGGLPGYHAAWFGQSGVMYLCPGEESTATVAYYNTGSRGWVGGAPGEAASLGTWNPSPGQDRASLLGGDGTNGSPASGWPSFNRPALQPSSYVGPGQVAWFQFRIRAPMTAGRYALALRPLIEGVQWMEDESVLWYVVVLSADGSTPPSLSLPAAPYCATADIPSVRARDDDALAILDPTSALPPDYAPTDLVPVSAAGFAGAAADQLRIRAIVIPDLASLHDAAAREGVTMSVLSAYRSYAEQAATFAHWVGVGGYEEALRTSARPGHSEHQLGTTVDLDGGGGAPWTDANFAQSALARWLAEHAARYGFVLSYPEGKEAATCYAYEPWQVRWVGRGIAARVAASDLTLREYLGLLVP